MAFNLPRSWTHIAVGCETREEAITETWAFYRAYPGRRRKDPEAAFEIYQVRRDRIGNWVVYLRRRAREA